jgi:ABC-type Fe3+/spermidine/putrescine transport system ATPase subunit
MGSARPAVPPHLELVQVSKFYDSTRAVENLSVELGRGGRLALLGPSGCGKTTTINLIAGFLAPDHGVIRISGEDVTRVPPNKRKTGMVFQSYALFPHLTVFENLAFGLRIRKIAKPDIQRRVERALAIVRLSGLEARYPRQLSGGQQQRVALARALIIEPDILLLDEPLSNLDAKLRQQMRIDLLEILREVGTTTILVTHDQEEALALADRVAVMNQGRVEQVGAPIEVYENPATSFVAKFLGESNVISGALVASTDRYATCDIGGGLRVRSERPTQLRPGAKVEAIVRVERLHLATQPLDLPNSFPGRVEHVMHLGSDLRHIIRLGEHRIIAVDKARGDRTALAEGTDIHVGWAARETLIVPAS